MPIPKNLDPYYFTALVFGVHLPSNTRRGRDGAIDSLCEYLEITPNQRQRLGKSLERLIPALTAFTARGNEGWLEFPEKVSRLLIQVKPLTSVITRIFTKTRQEKIGRILDRPRIPPSTLQVLLPVMLARASRHPDDPASEPRSFCLMLLRKYPEAAERALNAYQNKAHSTSGDEVGEDPLPLQRFSRILARLERAEKYTKRPREAVEAALHAWAGAFEDTVFNVVLFIWFVSQPLDAPPEKFAPPQGKAGRDQSKGRQEVKKGIVFKEALDWCNRQGIQFPVYPKLDKLRHSQAHEDYTLSAATVELRGIGGVLDRMTTKELVARVHHDVHFAHFFQQGLIEAEAVLREAAPEVESAWKTATRLMPELKGMPRKGANRSDAKPTARRTNTKGTAGKKAKANVATTGRSRRAGSPVKSQ